MINLMGKSTAGGRDERRMVNFAVAVATVLVLLDQITKQLVVGMFRLHEQRIVIPGFFNLTYITNKGAAWGMFHGYGWALLLVSLVVMGIIVWRMRALTEGWHERYLALFLIMSGIVGNSIDRLWRKEVVDFLDFQFFGYHWPAFNVADSAITVGVTIYLLSVLFRPGKETVVSPPDAS
ncbi:MAG: signal peptidase II [Victivallales bacterium]|nr:signal peptidase II [Victivallales bacterium]